MSCVPRSGGCEKRFLDPFVDYLNEIHKAAYAYSECLDVNDRNNPQPEALYLDTARNHRLVIERKSISWPADFPHRHANDHFVADLFSAELKEHQFDSGLYEISLPMLISGTQRELRPFVEAAAKKIHSAWPKVKAGAVVGERLNENWWWSFRRVPDWDRDDDAPTDGLKFSWTGRIMQLGDYIDPAELPEQLVSSLGRIFSGCVKKFTSYSDAEKIVLLDPCGDLEYKDVDWWKTAFLKHCPPDEIDAIWSGRFDHEWMEWVFEQLH